MNYRLISLFHSLLDDLITGCRYKNAHKRADDIKDAIREISPSRYAKDCRLCHTASRPRDQHGGDGDGVFRCPAKQAALESRCLYTSLNISLFRMMAINWSAVQMFKDNPDTTVEATMLVRPRMKCKKIRVMLSSMPLADMAPPKHMAQMISQIVFIIPAIPRVETREFRASLPVCICVLS